ncbi:hypothetical protein, partial [Rhizobium sp.]|uniref:hypothetical protein n=1 Tax=Rhizobium sp. TaxID=391 RepID=UPI000E8989FC|nr:hypothetical protein [Rhizobium sp.]
CIHEYLRRSSRYGSVVTAMALIVAIASIFVFPWLAGTTFGPIRIKGEVDFSALRANPQLAARNDNKHLRDADRDDGKGGTPPSNTVYVDISDVHPDLRRCSEDMAQPRSRDVTRSFYKGRQQPRAPPIYSC